MAHRKSSLKSVKSASRTGNRKPNSTRSGKDIIQLILADHRPLWQMIKVMKSESASIEKKRATFEKFVPTLLAHAKPEEQTWYKSMENDQDMSVEGLEGEIEHGLANQLCEELKVTCEHDMFMAKVKVLAELVEHHLEEEEEELLPEFKKETSLEDRRELGARYLSLQEQFKNRKSKDLRLVA
jgi:hemerythrin superfamily protein